MKKPPVIVIGILAALFLLSLIKDLIIKASVEKYVETATGLKISTKSLKVGIFNSAIRINDLKVYNPKAFKDRVMADMPEIYVDYDLPAIISGKMRLRKLRLNLKEFVVVKNAKGELNLNSLKVVKSGKGWAPAAVKERTLPPIQIDDMHLKIGKAVYKDYSASSVPLVKEFNVNIDERYTDVTNAYVLVSLIVVRSLQNTSISGLANFDIIGIKGMIPDTLASAQTVATKTIGAAHETVKQTAQQTREAVKTAAESLGGLFK